MEAIRLEGRSGHSSNPALGVSALEGMHRVIGELLRWRVIAVDSGAVTSTAPAYLSPDDSDRYFGTAALAPATAHSRLPVAEWTARRTRYWMRGCARQSKVMSSSVGSSHTGHSGSASPA